MNYLRKPKGRALTVNRVEVQTVQWFDYRGEEVRRRAVGIDENPSAIGYVAKDGFGPSSAWMARDVSGRVLRSGLVSRAAAIDVLLSRE